MDFNRKSLFVKLKTSEVGINEKFRIEIFFKPKYIFKKSRQKEVKSVKTSGTGYINTLSMYREVTERSCWCYPSTYKEIKFWSSGLPLKWL